MQLSMLLNGEWVPLRRIDDRTWECPVLVPSDFEPEHFVGLMSSDDRTDAHIDIDWIKLCNDIPSSAD